MVKKKCGKLIKDFIEKYGCTKKSFAKNCGCSYSTLIKIMNGDESVKIDKYIGCLFFIGVKYTEFLNLYENK